MTLEALIGAVGIVVAAITFIGGMFAFSGLDTPGDELDPAPRSESAAPRANRVP